MEDSSSVLSSGRQCNDQGYSYSWQTGETPRLSKGKKVLECNIENFVTMFAATTQNAVPSIEFSKAMGNYEREQKVEDTMLHLLGPFTDRIKEYDASSSTQAGVIFSVKLSQKNPSMTKLLRLSPMRREFLWQKDTKSKKGNIGCQPREITTSSLCSLSERSQF